jgi:hypothetical protein
VFLAKQHVWRKGKGKREKGKGKREKGKGKREKGKGKREMKLIRLVMRFGSKKKRKRWVNLEENFMGLGNWSRRRRRMKKNEEE